MTARNRRSRLWHEWGVLSLALGAFTTLAIELGAFPRVGAAIYDSFLATWERPAAANIVIVAIDDASLRNIGLWPWPRSVHATLIGRLKPARAVFLDLLLTEQDPLPLRSAILAEAIREHGRIVLPLREVPFGDVASTTALPLPGFAAAAAALGHAHFDPDRDGLLRRVHLREGPAGERWPHAAVALWELGQADGAPPPRSRVTSVDNPVHERWERDDEFPIAFAGGPGRYTRIPYVAVLRGDLPESYFRDKFVLVGATAPGLGDLYATPAESDGRLMPGVEVTANVLQQLQEHAQLRTAPKPALVVIALVLVLMAMALNAVLAPRWRIIATVALAALTLAAAAFALRWLGVWLPPEAALIAILSAYPLWSWRRLEAAQGFLDSELARLRRSLHREGATTSRFVRDPLDERISAIQAANDEITRHQKAREEAISFLSHDMRAPQVSILAMVDAHRQGMPADEAFWGRLESNARATLALAQNLVQLHRAEEIDGRATVAIELASLVEDVLADAWPRLRARELGVSRRLAEEAWVVGDRALLARALHNLIDNAIGHAPRASAVVVGVERAGGEWQVSVADEGDGVADERKDAIFRRFETGGGSTSGGTGLGLALVRAVAARFGGRAWVEDNAPRGARFVIGLPAIAAPG